MTTGIRLVPLLFLVPGLYSCSGGGTPPPPTPNPAPALTALNPSSAVAGRQGFTLTATGSNLISGSVLRWNGADRTTTFVSGTQLAASIPASDIAAAGSAQVAVFNPSPGGGTSTALTFAISPTFPARVLERLSVASDGTQANNVSPGAAVSADGRFVAFQSEANNLVAGDTNAAIDIFVRDTCLGATGCTPSTVRVSVASDGTQANGDSAVPSISADGRFVSFGSLASNLVAGDTNAFGDVFVRDTCLGAAGCTPSTVRVSVASDGTQGDDTSDSFSISADGRFVAFESDASNLVAGDTNLATDIFIRDTCRGATGCTPSTVRVSVASDGTQANGNSFGNANGAAVSADGRFVAFQSDASNLVADDTNAASDIFVRDTCLGATGCTPSTVRVSVASDGTQTGGGGSRFLISPDGRFVAFESGASDLVVGDTNAALDIFVRDTCLGATGCTPSTVRVSVASDGTQANDHSFGAAISSDGRFVAFSSGASNLVVGDTNAASDIFVRDTCLGATGCTPSTVRVSVGATFGFPQANGSSSRAAISSDGRFVAFQSDASNLVAGDTNGVGDVFLAGTVPITD